MRAIGRGRRGESGSITASSTHPIRHVHARGPAADDAHGEWLRRRCIGAKRIGTHWLRGSARPDGVQQPASSPPKERARGRGCCCRCRGSCWGRGRHARGAAGASTKNRGESKEIGSPRDGRSAAPFYRAAAASRAGGHRLIFSVCRRAQGPALSLSPPLSLAARPLGACGSEETLTTSFYTRPTTVCKRTRP